MEVGVRLAGRYKLVERLGWGGMGEVWRCTDEDLQRDVAVKVLHDRATSPEALTRFKREATIGARMRHPRITVVHDIARDDDRLFIVMELLHGQSLATRLAEFPDGLPMEEVVRLAVQVVEGLVAAHEQGVVHRDLKPENLFLHSDGVKICDFGIARSADATPGLTRTGKPFGTATYMAPEQWRGEHVDARCDLYALGCVLHTLLTGSPPFTGGYYNLMRSHVEETPKPPSHDRPDTPPALDALVLALLEKEPGNRPSRTRDVLTTLGGLVQSPGPTMRGAAGSQPSARDVVTAFHEQAEAAAERFDPARARDLAHIAVEVAVHVFGPDDQLTLSSRHDHAEWTGQAGNSTAARDLYVDIAADRARVLGPDHPDTLTSRHHHASWIGHAGNAEAARNLHEGVLADRIRLLGPDHPDTLASRHNQARWTGHAGNAEAARDLYTVVVADYTRVLGPDHPDTLTSRHNHAEWVGSAGNAEAARDLHEAVVADCTRVLGPDHPDTLSSRHSHAEWVGSAGNAEAARDLHEAVVADCTRVLGADHPDTLTSRHNHANWIGRAGDAEAARDLHEAVLADRARILGPDNPDILLNRHNHAEWTGLAGDAEAALSLHEAVLVDRTRIFGPDHPDTRMSSERREFWRAQARRRGRG
ncbi:serine/threonine-protein kinase [Streptomyces sp. NPDC097619]|uniref:serine/threonine-protein kinase n=1 Tax=Streptomyces sp. NPDC097619 TaxID=3157228 RepID=UPI0033198FD4